ncbi:transcriptional regulator, MarR family [Kribbella flavida DSM 17836]|uniref:Transcriptional regulator, MarR family n=1 Tax=Kribbella flavida (strain DSM 17836 / JCM 10339 / NBRC 14399) TaxID=479435 RepID=D2PVU2_KRIFD|nr:MarR family winged helix-turn-helix transcriptional regulator [Kribbella flavida]ADB29599.1 transcriptional regulator, MarR family [Kribbella flavida DSM 17836]
MAAWLDIEQPELRAAGYGEVIVLDEKAVHLTLAMHRIVRHLRRTAVTSALHPTQFIALLVIADEQPVRIGAIAARVPCSQPTATTTVGSLEAAGLVRRLPDTLDGRATVVELTEHGTDMVAHVRSDATEALSNMLAVLTPEDRAVVLDAGEILYRLADDL